MGIIIFCFEYVFDVTKDTKTTKSLLVPWTLEEKKVLLFYANT